MLDSNIKKLRQLHHRYLSLSVTRELFPKSYQQLRKKYRHRILDRETVGLISYQLLELIGGELFPCYHHYDLEERIVLEEIYITPFYDNYNANERALAEYVLDLDLLDIYPLTTVVQAIEALGYQKIDPLKQFYPSLQIALHCTNNLWLDCDDEDNPSITLDLTTIKQARELFDRATILHQQDREFKDWIEDNTKHRQIISEIFQQCNQKA